jgi:hypothetical protein
MNGSAKNTANLTPETLAQFDSERIDEIVQTNVIERTQERSRIDEDFKRILAHAGAQKLIEEYLEERRPQGAYCVDALIPISADTWKEMPKATREDLLNWYELESNPDNLDYIVDRVNAWGLKHATLAELEATKFPDLH